MNVVNPLKIIFPFYHTVSDGPLIHVKNLYRIRTVKEFSRDIDFFLRFFKPIDPQEIADSIRNIKPIKGRRFLLTFDDGLSQCYDIIAPILKKKGLNAIFFVNPDFIDNKDLFYRYKASVLIEKLHNASANDLQKASIAAGLNSIEKEDLINFVFEIDYSSKLVLDKVASALEVDFKEFLQNERPYLSTQQISSLVKDGFYVGSHSLDHPQFNKLSIEEQLFQVISSMEILQNTFNLKHRFFSFPFTDYGVSKEFFEKTYDLVNPVLDLSFGTAGIKSDSFRQHLQRIPIENYPVRASYSVLFQYLYYATKAPFRRNLIRR
jgi:peptidoglycan/xylan/chitin deacetylase (PgdA/CDA1 family)